MDRYRHHRLKSESSTETNTSNDGICDKSRQFQSRDDYKTYTFNTSPTNLGHQTGYKENTCLQEQTAHYRELEQIFDEPKAQLEERAERLKHETDDITRQLSNNNWPHTKNEEILSSNPHNMFDGTQTVKRDSTSLHIPEPSTDFSDYFTDPPNEVHSHNKAKLSKCRCCFNFHDKHSKKTHHEHRKGQRQGEIHENCKPFSAPVLKTHQNATDRHISCECYKESDKGEVIPVCNEGSDTGNVDPNLFCKTRTESNNNQRSMCDKKKETLDGRQKVRDEIIHDYQLQEMICHKAIKQKLDEDYAEIQKLRRNYSSLRKLFLALAILNIILILCVVSVMPVILVTFKLANEQDGDVGRLPYKELSSVAGKEIVKDYVLCVKCDRIKESSWADMFTRKEHKRCCIEDVASLVERIMERIKYDNQRRDDVDFKPSFNGSKEVAPWGSQFEKNSKLINKLLSRKRSALHLSGKLFDHRLEWQQGLNTGQHLRRHGNDMIKVENGGVYYVYSCIHFDAGLCNSKHVLGYQILMRHGKRELTVASAQHSCVNGTNTEQDLSLQQVVDIPVDRTSGILLYIRISSNHGLISKKHQHSFGLFEI